MFHNFLQGKSIINNSVKIVLCIFLLLALLQGVQAAETYTFVTKWGTERTADGQFNAPMGVAIDSVDDIPTIESATLSTATITNGGVVTLTVVVHSVSPANWLSSSLNGPNGNIFGGGHGCSYTKISENTWQYQEEYTVTQYAPSGTYTWSEILVENENQRTSEQWPQLLTFQVNNGDFNDTPTIESAILSTSTITNGGVVTLTVVVHSVSPANWLSSSLNGPNGNIFGGGHGCSYTKISENTWQYQEEYTVTQYAPSGTYTWSEISVENENQRTSEQWPQLLTFQVNNGAIAPPVAGFTGSPTSGAAPLTVTFTDSSTGSPTSWSWNFGDNSSVNATAKNPVHTYTSKGTYNIALTATNSAGSNLFTQTNYITVTSDITRPTITITSPTAGQKFTTANITVSGNASDNVGLSKVEVKVGSGLWQTATGTTSWSKSVTLASGSNKITARATDTSGNYKETTVTVTYKKDVTRPTITIKSPKANQKFTTATITVSGTASDAGGLSKVEVKVGSGAWQTATGTTSWSTSVTLASGSNKITARATDTAGNTKDASVTVTYNTPTPTPTPTPTVMPTPEPTQVLPDNWSIDIQVASNGEAINPQIFTTLLGGKGINVIPLIEIKVTRSDGIMETGTMTQPLYVGKSVSLASTTAPGYVDRNEVWATTPLGERLKIFDAYIPFRTYN